MEELKELLENLNNAISGKDTLPEDAYEDATEIVKNASQVVIVATDNGVGYAGTGEGLLSAWSMLTLKLMNELDAKDIMDKAFDVCKELSELPKEEQSKALAKKALEATKHTVERMQKETSLSDKLKKINEELEELEKEAE